MTPNDKIDKIYNGVQDIKIELAKYVVRLEQQRTEIDNITKLVDKHEKDQNKFIGVASVTGLGLTAFFTWLFKQF